MGPVSLMDPLKTKPTSALFTAADANESGTYVDAHDIVARKRIFAGQQRDEQNAVLGQGAQPAQRPAHVEVPGAPGPGPGPQQKSDAGGAGILSRPEWAYKVHPELASKRRLPSRILRRLDEEYQNYVNNQLAVAQLGQGQQRIDRSARRDDLYEARTGAMYPPGWRESSRGKPEDALAAAAIAEQLAAGKTPTAALRAYKSAAAGGKTPAGAKNLIENVFGIAGFGGLLDDLEGKPTKKHPDKGPVLGWLKMYRELSAFLLVSPDFSDAVSGILAEYAPTPEQLREALDSGKLTPEQQSLVQQTLGQLETMEAQPAAMPAAMPAARPEPAGGFTPPTFLGE